MRHLLYPGCFMPTISTSHSYLSGRALPPVMRLGEVYLAYGQAASGRYNQGLKEVFGQAT